MGGLSLSVAQLSGLSSLCRLAGHCLAAVELCRVESVDAAGVGRPCQLSPIVNARPCLLAGAGQYTLLYDNNCAAATRFRLDLGGDSEPSYSGRTGLPGHLFYARGHDNCGRGGCFFIFSQTPPLAHQRGGLGFWGGPPGSPPAPPLFL